MFTLVDRWFWLLCIVVTLANAAIFHVKAQRRIRANPKLADGYAKLIRGFVIWTSIPWIVMGIGSTLGGVSSVAVFLRPRDGNPFVIAFFGSILLLYALGTFWLFFRGGAEMLVEHPGMFNLELKSTKALKIGWCLSVIGGVAGFVVMLAMDPAGSAVTGTALQSGSSCRDFTSATGDSLGCRVAFDILSAGYKSWRFDAFFLIFVVIGAGLFASRKKLPVWKTHRILVNVFASFFLGFALLLSVGGFLASYSQYDSLVDATRGNRVETYDGIVTDFVPMPASGHALEHFCVGGKCFDYSDYSIQSGFNNTSSHGGPIREGLPVRVTCVGGTITRLEVAVSEPADR